MTAKRGSLFPSTSIGRSQSGRLVRSPSHESLTAHPLLSPGPSPPNSVDNSNGGGGDGGNTSAAPRYVPYTPRQRAPPTAATASTNFVASSSSSSQQHQGDATSKLQLMNLKAAAQKVGLEANSVGWAMLEKLVTETKEDWSEIWSATTAGKATLLLPLEAHSDKIPITPELVKDHIALYDGSSRKNSQIVTLSGLRGVLNEETFTLRSSLHPSSKIFQELLIVSSRTSTLTSLPPLPTLPTPSSYPTFTLPSYTSSLPLPPRTPPPLPPRPNQTPRVSATSRISNPFASLFGRDNHPTAQTSPPLPAPSPPASIHSIEDHIMSVCAFTIDRTIVFRDVAKDLTRGLRGEIKASFAASSSCPSWVPERVLDFTSFMYPILKAPKKEKEKQKERGYMVNFFADPPEEVADVMKEFYDAVERDLRTDEETDAVVEEVLERIEETVGHVFYDRLFLQPTSDDVSHDEALTSRVAALNMLDLTLAHLDIVIEGGESEEIASVVRACGEMLSQLETCRTPSTKGAIMVAAHKIIVDGLAKGPPIRLKSEDDPPVSRPAPPKIIEPVETELPDVDAKPAPDIAAEPAPHAPSEEEPIPAPEEQASVKPPDPPTSLTAENATLAMSKPSTPQPVSGDLLFPLLIFSVVKSNPPHLISHLLFTQRFRFRSEGEEAYCLINLLAVAEFLENVDMGALGLASPSVSDLAPIPIPKTSPALTPHEGSFRDQVDAIAGSANKVLTGVVDSSFGMLRSLLPVTSPEAGTPSMNSTQGVAPWNGAGVGGKFGLLRRESGFSIASMLSREKGGEEKEKELVTVSRPGSVKSRALYSDEEDSEGSEDGSDNEESDEEEESDGDVPGGAGGGDARSIRSFESMMSGARRKEKAAALGRKSLTDRLAGLAPRKHTANRFDTPASSRPASPMITVRLSPPNQRFLECSPGDLKISEVSDLLQEYRRLVEGVRSIGGFQGDVE